MQRKRRRLGIAAVLSAAAHVAVITIVALQAPRLRIPHEPAGPPPAIIPILLAPKPPAAAQLAPIRLHRRRQPFAAPPAPEPTPPVTLPARPAARGPDLIHPAPLPEGPKDQVRLTLRGSPVGCANPDAAGLNRAEREHCLEQLGKGVKTAPFMPAAIDPAQRAFYDAVVEAKKPDKPLTPIVSAGKAGIFGGDPRGVTGHGPEIGCSIQFGPGEKRKLPHALKLGPCYIEPPQGPLTVEADIQNPDAELRHRTD